MIEMDLKIFQLKDFESRFRMAQMPARAQFREDEVKDIDIAIFFGGRHSRQIDAIEAAVGIVLEHYKDTNTQLHFTWIDNDKARSIFGGPFELTQEFLRAGIHVNSTHWHQGNLRANHLWNMDDMLANKEDWRFHLGFPCGRYIGR